MPRSVLLRLMDIRAAISGIDDLVRDVAYDVFVQNWAHAASRGAGSRDISEATRHIPGDYKAPAAEIPWHQIAAIGNLLRHEYQRADSAATWNIITEHLPGLAKAVDRLVEIAHTREAQ